MTSPNPARLLALAAAAIAGSLPATPAGAADFAPKGAKAVLTAEYVYTSSGRRADKYDSHEWQVRRSVAMRSELVAGAPTPLASLQPPDAQQIATIERQKVQAEKASRQMAPMMAGAEAIVAKCGEDEKCLEREAMKMGAAMAGTKQLDDTLKTGRETAAVMQPGAPRYQAWQATSLSGSYQIEESAKIVDADPLCMERPGARCHREEKRSGSGAVPPPPDADAKRGVAGVAAAEVDAQGRTLFLRLPQPLNVLACTETIVSDKPGFGGSGVPRPCRQNFAAAGRVGVLQVALPAGARSAAGEQTLAIAGTAGEGGQLVVRWRFAPQ
jgi:hypothetical protein